MYRDGQGEASSGHDADVRLILNLIWLFLGGLWLALSYVIFGLIACIFIVTIPWAIGAFRIAGYAIWPFGRTIVAKPGAGIGSGVGNVIWAVVAGIGIIAVHLFTALLQAITIIGIPLALANLKMIPITLRPLGKDVVPIRQLQAWQRPAASGLPGQIPAARG